MSAINNIILFLLFFLSTVYSFARSIRTELYFEEDSFIIGEHIHLNLIIQYPHYYKCLAPDSTYDFNTLDYVKKTYKVSFVQGSTLIDTIQYTLSGFQLITTHYQALPLIFINQLDTLYLLTNKDSIHQISLVNSSNAALQDSIQLETIQDKTNYPKWIVLVSILLLSIATLQRFFGKFLIKRYKLFKLTLSHNKFIQDFDKLIQKQMIKKDTTSLQELVLLWKVYIGKLDEKTLTTLTTKELGELYPQDNVLQTLEYIDQTIYGNKANEVSKITFNELKQFSTYRYQKKKRSILIE